MKVLPYNKENLRLAVRALKQGQVVVIPTETCYGLAVDATNKKAVERLYRVKGRDFNKPVHVFVSSIVEAKKIIAWNKKINVLAREFWPGPLTIVAKLRGVSRGTLDTLGAGTGFLGVRISSDKTVRDIARILGNPITGTSANVSGMPDCYKISDCLAQFKRRTNKPDILIDVGTLPFNIPSTVVKSDGENFEVLREGPISKGKIERTVARIK